MSKKTDLDVDSPEKVVTVLRQVVDDYYASGEELSSSWQSKQAGAIWIKIARILDSAVSKIEQII